MLQRILLSILPCFLIANAYGFGGSVGTSIYSNFKSESTGENNSFNVIMGQLGHQAGDLSLGVSTSAMKSLVDNYSNYELGNVSMTATHFIELDETLKLNSTFSSALPVSKFSRDIQNLYTSLGHSFSLPIKLGEKTSLSLRLSNRLHLYQYETDVNGSSNVFHQHTIGASFGHRFYDWLSTGVSFSGTKNFTHNNVATDSYVVSANMTATWKKLYFSAGYEKFDQFLDPSGRSTNISVFDLDTSMFSLTIGTNF